MAISMRLWWRRHRLLLRLIAVLAGGVIIGIIATVWIPDAWAGAFGAIVAAVFTAALLGIQAELQQRSVAVRRLPTALEISSPRGRFPLVRDLSDPVAAGVHPAEAIRVAGVVNRVPPYITRDIEPELHAALRRDGFVLIVGESTAGKTRMAFEAARILLGDYLFIAPSYREALRELLDGLSEIGNYVVWLDDLERFLGPDGLTVSVLHRMFSPQVRTVVLATMRTHEYERYRDRAEGELARADRDVWREGRAVLRQAEVIHVERRWTASEQLRARAHVSDRRLARALAGADRFGVSEILAAGPELAEAWRNAWTPGGHPRGAALVEAAVGARRAGFHRPLSLELLERMHIAYLAQRGGPELRPEPLADALWWASTPTFPGGANSLLIGSVEAGYLAFEYLIDLPVSSLMTDSSWSALVDYASGSEAYMLAEHAVREGRQDEALLAYRRAAMADNVSAEAMLSEMGTPIRPPSESLEHAQQYLRQLRREHGADHHSSIEALQSVLMLSIHSGRFREAFQLAEELTARSELLLGPTHRTALAARYSLAYCTVKLGDIDEGIRKLDIAIEEARRALGELDVAVADRRISVVNLLVEAERIDAAEERLTEARSDYSSFPPGHIIATRLEGAAKYLHDAQARRAEPEV